MSQDLHASDPGGGGGFGDAAEVGGSGGGGDDGEIWQQHDDLLMDVDDSLFYDGGGGGDCDFPPLPDFPCMSSSSSTSSTPAISCSSSSSTSSASSSSAASWAVLKCEDRRDRGAGEEYGRDQTAELGSQAALSSTTAPADNNCMDAMESFEYMDLMDSNEFFDPCSIFQQDYGLEDFQVPDFKIQDHQENGDFFSDQHYHNHAQHQEQDQEQQVQFMMIPTTNTVDFCTPGDNQDSDDDLGAVFLEWLKSNKETVCAEDLRRVKIKKATIESAAKRLGGGKEAMKQLLKLILEWVQSNHLQKRRLKEAEEAAAAAAASNLSYQPPPPPQEPPIFQNPNPNFPQHSQWLPQPPQYDPAAAQGFPPVVTYPQDYHMLDTAQTWPASQFSFLSSPYNNSYPDPNRAFVGYNNQYQHQYFQGNGERLVRLGSSATKEARKKRMARQRRLFTHHRSHSQNQNQNQNPDQQHARHGSDNCTTAGQANPGNWMYHWPNGTVGVAGSASPALPPVDAMKACPIDRPGALMASKNTTMDRRQGWKPEKNLRFLLQKVLKQSDVGNLGRIVLPKKEAETHLPELEARDGIAISMEDIGTSRVWNMRYRFWPNNKSRMYLLENTGDFVRANGLQEGDFIVIYSDVKCGKYLIRGVKVRQPAGPKSESAKRPAKSQRNQLSSSPAGNGLSSSPATEAVK